MGLFGDDDSGWGWWKVRLLIGVPVGIGAAWWGFHQKGETDHKVLDQAKAMVMTAPSYQANSDYFDAVVADCHKQVFDENYDMGGRHRSAKFYEEDYYDELFACMIQKFEADGATHIVPELKAIHDPGR